MVVQFLGRDDGAVVGVGSMTESCAIRSAREGEPFAFELTAGAFEEFKRWGEPRARCRMVECFGYERGVFIK